MWEPALQLYCTLRPKGSGSMSPRVTTWCLLKAEDLEIFVKDNVLPKATRADLYHLPTGSRVELGFLPDGRGCGRHQEAVVSFEGDPTWQPHPTSRRRRSTSAQLWPWKGRLQIGGVPEASSHSRSSRLRRANLSSARPWRSGLGL